MRPPLFLVVAALAATSFSSPLVAQSANEWSAYGRDAGGTRSSPLTQVTPANVNRLVPAWTYRTGEFARADERSRFEATPLMVDGTLYLSTPFGRAIALDPATGRERWTYDAHVDATNDFGDPASRGVSTWLDPQAKAGAQLQGIGAHFNLVGRGPRKVSAQRQFPDGSRQPGGCLQDAGTPVGFRHGHHGVGQLYQAVFEPGNRQPFLEPCR